ncbi:MAG: hypothetical protein KF780_08460 [Sphingomonas sp.]|nr:hypothetical protein [Sphingomonas sp.]
MLNRLRLNPRRIMLGGAGLAGAVALLVLYLGYRHDLYIDRIVAEGRLAQGEYLGRRYGSCSSGEGCESDEIQVSYQVDGVAYRTSMFVTPGHRSEAIFQPEVIRMPRLGEERLFQVVYLPSDPSVARLRADISKSDIAVYGTAGMFLLVSLVFAAVALFALPREEGGH